jgi:hypothetical protein
MTSGVENQGYGWEHAQQMWRSETSKRDLKRKSIISNNIQQNLSKPNP